MKLNIRIIFFVLILFTTISSLTYDKVSADNSTIAYKILARKLKDNKKYIWSIEFNQEVDDRSLTTESIYVLNGFGNKMNNVDITLDNNKNIVKVENKYDYRINEEYTIVLENTLMSSSGKNLSEPLKFPFMIVLDRPEAPSAPKVMGRPSANTIKLEEIKSAEYSIFSINDVLVKELKWQESNIFMNLELNTSYRFVARIKETSDNLESDISPMSETIKTTNDYIIVRFDEKIGFGDDILPFGVAKIETNVPESYSYELTYEIAGGIKAVTPRTVIDSTEPPLFRYTEYIDIKLFDKLGRLVQEFRNVKVER